MGQFLEVHELVFFFPLTPLPCVPPAVYCYSAQQFSWQPNDCRGQEMTFDAMKFIKLMSGK